MVIFINNDTKLRKVLSCLLYLGMKFFEGGKHSVLLLRVSYSLSEDHRLVSNLQVSLLLLFPHVWCFGVFP